MNGNSDLHSSDERMLQKLHRRQPPRWLLLQTKGDKASKFHRSRRRRNWRLRITDGAHQTSPISLPAHVLPERKLPQIKLQNTQPEAPYIPGVPIVNTFIKVRVYPLRAHVSNGADGRVTRIHGLRQNPRHAEIRDLDLVGGVDEQVRGLDIAVHDLLAMEISQAL